MSRWIRAGATAWLAVPLLTACVIRPGVKDAAPDVEQFASSGEALDKLTTAGLASTSDVKKARGMYADLLEEVAAQIEAGQDSVILAHHRLYLERTVRFYDALIPLYEASSRASVESRPGISAQIYEAEKAYLADLADLDRDLDLPSVVPAPIAAIPTESTLEEGDLSAEVELDEADVVALYQARQYAEVVATVAEAGDAKSRLSPAGRAIYALSLAEQGLFTEAIREAEGLADRPLVAPDVLDLRLDAAVWMVSADQRGAAERALRDLVDDSRSAEGSLTNGERVARAMLDELSRGARDPALIAGRRAMEQEHFIESRQLLQGVITGGGSTEARNRAEVLLNQLASAEDKAFERRLSSARELGSAPSQRQQALAALDQLQADFPADRFQSRIAAVRGEVEGTVTSQDVSYVERLEAASDLLAAKKYEAAAAEFLALYGTPVSADAQAGRERAVDLYVQEVREEMARDYLAAKRISDPEKRLAALKKVHDKLEAVSRTYPESRMIPKLASNIEVVKGEILKIDPAYFDEPVPAGSP